MATNTNKVKYNIKNVHYAVKIEEGYDTPVAWPGAVSISLEQQGEINTFYADGVKYYVSATNGGYEGDLETALVPDQFREDVLGEQKDANGVLIETSSASKVEFALGFQIDGDFCPTLFWFYNCTATRPSLSSQTNEDTITPQTDTLTVSCSGDDEGLIRAKTTSDSYSQVSANWFNEVYKKAEGAG